VPSGQTYVSTYDYLYNWFAVNDAKGLCPSGWHVPTNGDWYDLTNYLGGDLNAGSKMKSPSLLWTLQNVPIVNSSGFTALPGGRRSNDGTFVFIRDAALFWSATQDVNPSYGESNYLEASNSAFKFNPWPKSTGLSVRCLKD